MDSDHGEHWLPTSLRIRVAHVAHQEGSRLADDTYPLLVWGKQFTFLVSSVCMCACSCVCVSSEVNLRCHSSGAAYLVF